MTSDPTLPPAADNDGTEADPRALHAAFAPARLDAATVQRLLRAVQRDLVALPEPAGQAGARLDARGHAAAGPGPLRYDARPLFTPAAARRVLP